MGYFKKNILFLSNEQELTRERKGYFDAFSALANVILIPDFSISNINNIIQKNHPILILHPEPPQAYLPHELNTVNIPTGCFQIDTFSGTQKRIKWSMLFDYVFVFHPKFDQMFEKAGHPNVVFLPHSVEADLFSGLELERIYEVGWVGNLKSYGYNKRREVIEDLASSFSMNDVNKYYDPKSMAEIYKQSKIVVNISRDNYPQDANLRCFEVMAGGALLITHKPTELEDMGFVEGIHYITYTKYSEIKNLVYFYLLNEEKRLNITQQAKHLVLSEYTYNSRAQQILRLLETNHRNLFAPARNWNKLKVHQVYLHFFANHLMLDATLAELKMISRISRSQAFLQIPLFIKAIIRALQLSL